MDRRQQLREPAKERLQGRRVPLDATRKPGHKHRGDARGHALWVDRDELRSGQATVGQESESGGLAFGKVGLFREPIEPHEAAQDQAVGSSARVLDAQRMDGGGCSSVKRADLSHAGARADRGGCPLQRLRRGRPRSRRSSAGLR